MILLIDTLDRFFPVCMVVLNLIDELMLVIATIIQINVFIVVEIGRCNHDCFRHA